jgi:glycosyltransferase involved in cell wall biosynthesis
MPTLVRSTLTRAVNSIISQTNKDWELLLCVDTPLIFNKEKTDRLNGLPKDDRIKIYRCGKQHGDYGNHCRHQAHDRAKGDYVLFLDDDDYLADDRILETLEQVTKLWAVFPIMRCGNLWFCDPPGLCKTGNGMYIYRRFLGLKYPDTSDYTADGALVEQLKAFPYQSLGHERPLMIYEQRGLGKE